MSVHVIVQYRVPYWDDCGGGFAHECYFEGDVKTVDWDGEVLKIGRRKFYTSEYLWDRLNEEVAALGYENYDECRRDAFSKGNLTELNRIEDARIEADWTDILHIKVGDMVLRDIRKKTSDEETNT